MGTPVLKLVFDRHCRATKTREGSVDLRITYERRQRFVTTGVRLLPRQWKNGQVVNRLDAFELQRTLDEFMTKARKIINDLIAEGTLDMKTVVALLNVKQRASASEHIEKRSFLDFIDERTEIRKYGRGTDSQARYDRFLRWFKAWGGITRFADLTEKNILEMDKVLSRKKMKQSSKWNNYHRFLNSFILDAIDDGLLRRNPYKRLNIDKAKTSNGLSKYLTVEELHRLETLSPPTNFLRHARDLFIFQTYTCLSYTDLCSFDASRIGDIEGRKVYRGQRAKTGQEYSFLLLQPAVDILSAYQGQLPLMSNTKYNECLKVLAVMIGVNKPVSSHWARHTGATLLLNGGVPMEIVAKVLGHSSTRITRQVYAKLLDTTIIDAMASFAEKSVK